MPAGLDHSKTEEHVPGKTLGLGGMPVPSDYRYYIDKQDMRYPLVIPCAGSIANAFGSLALRWSEQLNEALRRSGSTRLGYTGVEMNLRNAYIGYQGEIALAALLHFHKIRFYWTVNTTGKWGGHDFAVWNEGRIRHIDTKTQPHYADHFLMPKEQLDRKPASSHPDHYVAMKLDGPYTYCIGWLAHKELKKIKPTTMNTETIKVEHGRFHDFGIVMAALDKGEAMLGFNGRKSVITEFVNFCLTASKGPA